jgi:hypothetical protein
MRLFLTHIKFDSIAYGAPIATLLVPSRHQSFDLHGNRTFVIHNHRVLEPHDPPIFMRFMALIVAISNYSFHALTDEPSKPEQGPNSDCRRKHAKEIDRYRSHHLPELCDCHPCKPPLPVLHHIHSRAELEAFVANQRAVNFHGVGFDGAVGFGGGGC